jgi:Tol biopolymer transport system component
MVTISLQTLGNGHLTVTDLSGKTILNQPLILSNGKSQINIAGFESGMYLFNVSTDDGQSTQFRVVKK